MIKFIQKGYVLSKFSLDEDFRTENVVKQLKRNLGIVVDSIC